MKVRRKGEPFATHVLFVRNYFLIFAFATRTQVKVP